ncbi:M1 family metallopeptidase [Pseudomonadota bacterium]
MVYLRSADPATANHYLDATEHYLALYSKLLGAYPYSKFALVENFWETGYGMPSFTLLGPTVIRLPFIIHTSYPHEILHNWWGNGVYPDYASGNWSEGLTSYLADHLLQEQRGMGADYRRTTLQRYADSVKKQKDFPLTAFRSRHGQASQAIGYGKTMMFFHMLRQQLGDDVFIKGLRYFYKKNLFRIAGFNALRSAFEFVSKKDLSMEFKQWTTRIGAPSIKLNNVTVKKTAAGYNLTATIAQAQAGAAFSLKIPILVQINGSDEYSRHIFSMHKKTETLNLRFDNQPLRIKVDPQFDLFRQLDPSEIPSSFAQLFGTDQALIILPSKGTNELKAAYEKLANNWAQRSPALKIMWDTEIKNLPTDQSIWLLGESNILLKTVEDSIKAELFNKKTAQLILNKKGFSKTNHSFAVTTRNSANKQHTIGWVSAHSSAAIPHLFRKLPHYKKYSYLVFEGDAAKNIYKGKWPLDESALNVITHNDHIRPDLEFTSHPALVRSTKKDNKH